MGVESGRRADGNDPDLRDGLSTGEKIGLTLAGAAGVAGFAVGIGAEHGVPGPERSTSEVVNVLGEDPRVYIGEVKIEKINVRRSLDFSPGSDNIVLSSNDVNLKVKNPLYVDVPFDDMGAFVFLYDGKLVYVANDPVNNPEAVTVESSNDTWMPIGSLGETDAVDPPTKIGSVGVIVTPPSDIS